MSVPPGNFHEAYLVFLYCRCLPENESQCPNCARSHGVIREIRKNNEQFAGRHDLFLSDVRESEDGYKAITAAYGKGLMAFAVGDEA